MNVIIHGPTREQALARLNKVLSGQLDLIGVGTYEKQEPEFLTVSSAPEMYHPYGSGFTVQRGTELHRGSVEESDDSLVFKQCLCSSCGACAFSSEKDIEKCVECGSSDVVASNFEINSINRSCSTMKRNRMAVQADQDELDNEAPASIEDLDTSDDIDSLEESEDGDEEMNLDDDSEEIEESEDGDEETEDEETEDEPVNVENCKAVVASSQTFKVTRSSLKKATLAFGRKVEKFLAGGKVPALRSTMASAAQKALKTNVEGLHVAECSTCGFFTMASDEIKHLQCGECQTKFTPRSLVKASFVATFSDDEDEVVVKNDLPEIESDDDEDQNFDSDLSDSELEESGEEDLEIEDNSESEIESESEDSTEDDDDFQEEVEESEVDDDMIELDNEESESESESESEYDPGDNAGLDEANEDEDQSNEIEEIDLSESCSVQSGDSIVLSHVLDSRSPLESSRWQLSINDLPIATLSRTSLKNEELKTMATESFNRADFATKLTSALTADPSRTIEIAREIGFVGIKLPVPVDSIVKARTARTVRKVKASARKQVKNYTKNFSQCMSLAADGINRGFFSGASNPLKTALCKALEDLGVRGAAKIVNKTFAATAEKYHSLLIEQTRSLLARSPEVRRELSSAIKGVSMADTAVPEDDLENSDQENAEDGDNQVDQDALDSLMQSTARVLEPSNTVIAATNSSIVERTRAALRFGRKF